MRQRIARDAERKLTGSAISTTRSCQPSSLLDGLVNGQRVDKLVGDDDGGAGRNVVERGVPHDRHRTVPAALPLAPAVSD